jgi:hypothetical protein
MDGLEMASMKLSIRPRWRLVARDVAGTHIGTFGLFWTRWRAQRLFSLYSDNIPEPIKGRPLYSMEIERNG